MYKNLQKLFYCRKYAIHMQKNCLPLDVSGLGAATPHVVKMLDTPVDIPGRSGILDQTPPELLKLGFICWPEFPSRPWFPALKGGFGGTSSAPAPISLDKKLLALLGTEFSFVLAFLELFLFVSLLSVLFGRPSPTSFVFSSKSLMSLSALSVEEDLSLVESGNSSSRFTFFLKEIREISGDTDAFVVVGGSVSLTSFGVLTSGSGEITFVGLSFVALAALSFSFKQGFQIWIQTENGKRTSGQK